MLCGNGSGRYASPFSFNWETTLLLLFLFSFFFFLQMAIDFFKEVYLFLKLSGFLM